MPSIRNAISKLMSLQLLTTPLPRFSQSLSGYARSPQSPPPTPTWKTYSRAHPSTSVPSLLSPELNLLLIGESHHQPSILNLQLQALTQFSALHPANTVLVVEYFNLLQTSLLQAFMHEDLTIVELEAQYETSSENFDISGHLAPLLLLARKLNVPIVSGFPPREWAREYLREDSREAVLRRLRDEFDFPVQEREEALRGHWGYEAYFEGLLSGDRPRREATRNEDGTSGQRRGARIFSAQVLKDTVMAWKIDQELKWGKRVMAIAGIGHLEYGFGILERVKELGRGRSCLVVCKEAGEEVWLGGADSEGEREAEDDIKGRALADAVYVYDAA